MTFILKVCLLTSIVFTQTPQVEHLLSDPVIRIGMNNEIYFTNIADYTRDSNNGLYILDSGSQQVHVFNSDFSYKSSFGRKGQGPGEFIHPKTIIAFKEQIFVLDNSVNRISVFTTGGEYIHSISNSNRITDFIIHNDSIYMSVLSANTVVWRAPLADPTNQERVIQYGDSDALSNLHDQHPFNPNCLGYISDILLVGFRLSGHYLRYDLSDGTLTLLQPSGTIINSIFEYLDATQRPDSTIPRLRENIESWDDTTIIVDANAPADITGYASTALLFTLEPIDELTERSVVFGSVSTRYMMHKRISRDYLAAINLDNATLDIFDISDILH